MPHPIFTDFKHIKMHAKLRICFEPGLGGNWIGSQTFGTIVQREGVNEFQAKCVYFGLDTLPWDLSDRMEPIIRLDEAYKHALHSIDEANEVGNADLIMSHDLPFLSPLVFDYRAEETVLMEAGEDTHWFTSILYLAKDILDKHNLIKKMAVAKLLSNNPATGNIDGNAYYDMSRNLENRLGSGTWIRNTPLSWKWYINCLADGTDPTDIGKFRSYCTLVLFNHLGNWLKYSGPAPMNHKRSTVAYKTCRDNLKDTVVSTVDYGSLFFDLETPTAGILKSIEKQKLMVYTNGNLGLARKIAQLASDDIRDLLHKRIDIIEDRLRQASSS